MKPRIGNMLASLAAQGARKANVEQARICPGCAFRKVTPANQEREAAENTLEALMTDQAQFTIGTRSETTFVEATGWLA